MAPSLVKPGGYVALRLPSGTHKLLEILPNTTISIGKFGSFKSKSIIGRPYYLTFEIREKALESSKSDLRIVPASELHRAVLSDNIPANEPAETKDAAEYELVGDNGEVLLRTNQKIIDDPTRQTLSMEEIEKLKRDGSIGGADLVAKIISSHTAIDQKTPFSLAKYTLRKARKFLRRFQVLPLDVPMLTYWVLHEKDAQKVLEVRDETLALVGSWANVHYGAPSSLHPSTSGEGNLGGGRWLVVDETGGLLVAAMAERMGILYSMDETVGTTTMKEDSDEEEAPAERVEKHQPNEPSSTGRAPAEQEDIKSTNGITDPTSHQSSTPSKPHSRPAPLQSAATNTLTLIHPASQPNLSLLKYFSFVLDRPTRNHPLSTNLKTLSWLQLLHPAHDSSYASEPPLLSPDELSTFRSGKRSNYYRKRRRWTRIRSVVDETRAGGFDGLVVATASMSPTSILKSLVPLLRGGAQIAVYSPTIEPLMQLADVYSSARRTAFVAKNGEGEEEGEFPVDPRLLLAPTVQTARVRRWQCLPGRTHPLMTERGGAEGYVFTGTRVLPIEGKVEARGNFTKKRKVDKQDGQAEGLITEIGETNKEGEAVEERTEDTEMIGVEGTE